MQLYTIWIKGKNDATFKVNMHPMSFKEAIIVRSKLVGLAIKYKHRSVEVRRFA